MSHQIISTGWGVAMISYPHQVIMNNIDAAIMLIAPIVVGLVIWREYRHVVGW